MGMLLTVIIPFGPFGWIFPNDGPELLDRFAAAPLILGALFFQWRIAGQIGPLPIQLGDMAIVYKHTHYWRAAFIEFGVCVGVHYFQNEIVRRVTAATLVGALWAVGWKATPQQYKREAWQQLKWVWTYIAFNEAASFAGRRRRRW